MQTHRDTLLLPTCSLFRPLQICNSSDQWTVALLTSCGWNLISDLITLMTSSPGPHPLPLVHPGRSSCVQLWHRGWRHSLLSSREPFQYPIVSQGQGRGMRPTFPRHVGIICAALASSVGAGARADGCLSYRPAGVANEHANLTATGWSQGSMPSSSHPPLHESRSTPTKTSFSPLQASATEIMENKKDLEVFVSRFFKLHNYHLLFYPGIRFNFPFYKTETVWHDRKGLETKFHMFTLFLFCNLWLVVCLVTKANK